MRQRPQNFRINRNAKLAKGLVFAMLGGGASTLAALDSSGYGNNGTLTSMDPPTDWLWDTTLNRWVLDFDGSDDYVPMMRDLEIQPPITISCWAKTSSASRYSILAATGNYTRATNVTNGAYLQLRVDGALGVGYGNGGVESAGNRRLFTSNAAMSTSVWYSVVGVINSLGNDMAIYVNANLIGGGYNGTYVGSIAYDGTSGAIGWGSNTYVLGQIADVMIHTRALSVSEIASLADPSNVSLSGLVIDPRRRLFPVATGNRRRRLITSV